ncbi:hypothetical protein AB0C28_56050 [Nonomuraea sp. NPDC048892]|uniref:hypothetical protein n=1 Tax=Nonomuraea sp. NPDC048892 TaxID=3154624 RepID=UPI0034059187
MVNDPYRDIRIAKIAAEVKFARDHLDGRTMTLPWNEKPLVLPVIRIALDEVVLNPRSRRIISYLEDHPRRAQLQSDPFSEEAQAELARLLKSNPLNPTQVDPAYERLKADLALPHGQVDPGVVSHAGILFNANTRAVALRELGVRFIDVAVLPDSADQKHLEDVELWLQLRPNLEREYSYTSYLLAVEELIKAKPLQGVVAQIGRPESDILMAQRVLSMIRDLQCLGQVQDANGEVHNIPLTYFNDKQQSLEEIDRVLNKKTRKSRLDNVSRALLRDTRLLAMLGGATKLQLREIGENHLEHHLWPRLPIELRSQVDTVDGGADDGPNRASGRAKSEGRGGAVPIPGLNVALSTRKSETQVDVAKLLTAAAQARTAVEVLEELDPQYIAGDELLTELRRPIADASDDARAMRRRDTRLDTPAKKISEAAGKIEDAGVHLRELLADSEFDREALREVIADAQKALARISAALERVERTDSTRNGG